MQAPNVVCGLPAKSTDRDKLTTKRPFRYSGFVTDFVAVISSQSEGLGKMALGIVKIHLGSPFSANRRCPRSVCLRSVGSQSVVVDPVDCGLGYTNLS